MTWGHPDVSVYTQVSMAGALSVCARATIGNQKDSFYPTCKADANNRNIPFSAYHFLNSGSLGVSATAQADYAYSAIGSDVPVMLDWEPNRNACATPSEAAAWIDRFRSNGGTTHEMYLPKWVWGNSSGSSGIGAPSLKPFIDRGMLLVSSNYTTYSDSGPGWVPYGDFPSVFKWQWTSTYPFNGGSVDWNAVKVTIQEYWKAISGGTMADADIPDTHRRVVNIDEAYLWRGLALLQDVVPATALDGTAVQVPFGTATLLKRIDTNVAADLAEDKAATVAIQGLIAQINAAGGNVDAAPILAAIADVKATESTTVQGLQAEVAHLRAQLGAALAAAGQAITS